MRLGNVYTIDKADVELYDYIVSLGLEKDHLTKKDFHNSKKYIIDLDNSVKAPSLIDYILLQNDVIRLAK